MVGVAQLVRAPGCGPGGCRFKSGRSPLSSTRVTLFFVMTSPIWNPQSLPRSPRSKIRSIFPSRLLCSRFYGQGHLIILPCSRVDFYFSLQTIFQLLLSNLKVVMRLKVDPELRRHSKETTEPESRICRDGTLAMHNFIDAPRRHANVCSQSVLADIHRLQKFVRQNLTWMDGRKVSFHVASPSVVVNYFNLKRIIALPLETDAPLVIDPDTVLSRSIAAERFQPVPRRDAKRFKVRGRIEHKQLHGGRFLNVLRELLGEPSLKQSFRLSGSKSLDHGYLLTHCVNNVKGHLPLFGIRSNGNLPSSWELVMNT